MPTRSKAQWRLMQAIAHGKAKEGKGLSKEKAQEFIDATPNYKKLPEHKLGRLKKMMGKK